MKEEKKKELKKNIGKREREKDHHVI